MTSATVPRRILRPIASPPSFRSAAIGFLATLLAAAVLLIAASIAIGLAVGSAVMPNVSVGGVPVAGLDRADAEARLGERLPSLSSGSATLAVGEDEFVVSYADLGRGYEMDVMLAAAFEVGRNGNPLSDGIARLRALVYPTELSVAVHAFDPASLEAFAEDLSRQVRQHPVEAAVIRDDGGFDVRPAADGRTLPADDIHTALAAATASTDPADVRIELTPSAVPPIVDTEMATAAADQARATVADLELTVLSAAADDEPMELTGETIGSWLSFGPAADVAYALRLDATAAETAIGALAEQVNRDPVSARITVAGSGLGGVVAGQSGRELDIAGSTEALLAAFESRGQGTPVASLALAVGETEPALTTAAAETAFSQMERVSSWTTHYVSGEGNGFSANISIPAWNVDGYNVAPGEWFSFWEGIGPVTPEAGYVAGGAIINGRSVANGALAGGICSTSTTLFNAAMRAGLEIGARSAHYYYIDRYPLGLDATVSIFDGWVTDMTFRNDTAHPIVIRGYGTPGQVTFEIWSVPTGRTVALSDPIVTNRRSAGDTTQVDDSMAPGSARRVEYPHPGFQSSVTRTVYGADGSVVHQNTWFSDYRAVDGVTLVGPTGSSDEPEDEDSDEDEDEDAGETAGDGGVGDPPDDGGEGDEGA